MKGFYQLKKEEKKRLEDLSEEKRTMIFYESPHKISKTLNDLKAHFGDDRKVSVSKELTKIHESTIRGTLGTISLGEGKIRGEFVIVVEGLKIKKPPFLGAFYNKNKKPRICKLIQRSKFFPNQGKFC